MTKAGKTKTMVIDAGILENLEMDGVDDGVLDEIRERILSDRSIPSCATLTEMYSMFPWEAGLYRSELYRLTPKQVDNVVVSGSIDSTDNQITEDWIRKYHGGNIFSVKVRGPLPTDLEGAKDWRAQCTVKIGGPAKIPANKYPEGSKQAQEAQAREAGNSGADALRDRLAGEFLEGARETKAEVEKLRQAPPIVDPTTAVLKEAMAAQTTLHQSLMDAQANRAEAMMTLTRDALTSRGGSDDAEKYLATIESMKGAIETQQREHRSALDNLLASQRDEIRRADDAAREDRRYVTERHEKELQGQRDQRQRDIDTERQRASDAIKRVEDQMREQREELRDARKRAETLQDQLSEARIQAASAGKVEAKDPVSQMREIAAVSGELKGLFGAVDGADIGSKLIGLVESGAAEKTVGGIAGRIAGAIKGAQVRGQVTTENADAAKTNSDAWDEWQKTRNAAATQQPPQVTGRKRRRRAVRAAPEAPQVVGEETQVVGEEVVENPIEDSPGPEVDITMLPDMIEKSIDAGETPEQFLVRLRPLIGGGEAEAIIAQTPPDEIIGAVEAAKQAQTGETSWSMPFGYKQHLRRTLELFAEVVRQETSNA